MLHPHLLVKRQKYLNFCIQVERFSPYDTVMTSAFQELKLCPLINYLSNVTSPVWYGCNEEKLQDFTTF